MAHHATLTSAMTSYSTRRLPHALVNAHATSSMTSSSSIFICRVISIFTTLTHTSSRKITHVLSIHHDVVPLTQLCRLMSCTKCNSSPINHQCTYFLFHDLNTVSRALPPRPRFKFNNPPINGQCTNCRIGLLFQCVR